MNIFIPVFGSNPNSDGIWTCKVSNYVFFKVGTFFFFFSVKCTGEFSNPPGQHVVNILHKTPWLLNE